MSNSGRKYESSDPSWSPSGVSGSPKGSPGKLRRSSRRKRTTKQASPATTSTDIASWSEEELSSLYFAIRKHSLENITEIAKCVSTRSPSEIETVIKSFKQMKSVTNEAGKIHEKSSVSQWLSLVDGMTSRSENHSDVITKVLSVASTFEKFPKPTKNTDPDYAAVYCYLIALLNDEEPPNLRPIDAAMVLDLLDNLISILQKSDLSAQSELVLRKAQALRFRKNTLQPRKTYFIHHIALLNDNDLLNCNMNDLLSGSSKLFYDTVPVSDEGSSAASADCTGSPSKSKKPRTNDNNSASVSNRRSPKNTRSTSKKTSKADTSSGNNDSEKRRRLTVRQMLPIKTPFTSLNPLNISPEYLKFVPRTDSNT